MNDARVTDEPISYQINSYYSLIYKRHSPKNLQTGPNAILPDAVACLACRVSTRLRPARFAS